MTSVAVQQSANGRPLDDIVIEWEDDADRRGTLDLQLKRRLPFKSGPDDDFAKVVIAAWSTLLLPDFVDGRDLAGGLAESVSSDNLLACQRLRDQARLEADPEAFVAAIARQMGQSTRKVHGTVTNILERHLGAMPTSRQLHLFWRNFVIGQLQATNDLGTDRLRAIDQLERTRPREGANATQIFAVLEALAKQLNVRAIRVDVSRTVELLRDRFGTRLCEVPTGAGDALASGRRGAELELKIFRDRDQAFLIDPVFATREGKATERIVQRDGVEAELRAARSVILVGEPGAGKTQALHQIAVTLLAQPSLVPIVRSLPTLALRRDTIAAEICSKGSFATFSEADFAVLAHGAQLVLLLDGWNELNPDQRAWAWGELEALRRDYPQMLLVIATRAGAASPFAQVPALDVLPFDRSRQLDAASRLLGPSGHDLVVRARALPALRPLLRTPLFLAAILRQGAAGELPTDRETVIAGLVADAGGTPARREQLRLALDGQHIPFLRLLSDRLMDAGTTILSEAELIPAIGELAGDLRARQLLMQPIAPQAVLDILISHHLLVGMGEPGQRSISLQHQLIQEWFASFRVANMIENESGGAIGESLRALIDAPFWSVTILFAVERLAHAKIAPKQLQALVLTALGIDPFLAADMFHRSRSCMGSDLDDELIAFAERWSADDLARTNRFRLATGLEQFGNALWDALENGREFLFDLHRSGRSFPISTLEPDWKRRYPKLKSETRRVLLTDLVEQGDTVSLTRALSAAVGDPSADVVSSVIDYLDFRDERASLEHLLDQLPDRMWKALARGREPDNATDKHRARWSKLRRKRFEDADGIDWLRLALEFDCATPEAIVAATLDLKTDNHWTSHELEQEVFRRFPTVFQDVLITRLLGNHAIPYRASQFVVGMEPAEQSELITIATTKDRTFSRQQLAAQLLGKQSIASLVDHLVVRSGDRAALRSEESQAVRDALRGVRLELLVQEIAARTATEPHQAAILISILADWRGHEEERDFNISTEARETLIQLAQAWAALLLAQGDELRRYDLAELAKLIGRLASGALWPSLLALWDRDRAQHAEERALRAIDPSNPRANEAFMGYDIQYRAGANAIAGDVVIDAMAQRLNDTTFELDAALVLGELLEVDPVQQGPLGPSLDDLEERRDRLIERRASAPHPIAAHIIARIGELVAAGDKDSIGQAFRLAAPVTRMNYGDRGPALRTLIEAGKDNGLLLDFCKTFAERGEMLPAHIIQHGVALAAADLAAMKWVQENDYWRLDAWLRLVPFADDAEAALPSFDDLPGGARRRYRLHDLVRALGRSISPTAVRALVALVRHSPELLFEDMPQALARIGTDEADEALLDAVIGAVEDPKGWRDTYMLREALASALAHSIDVRSRAKTMVGEMNHDGKRTTIADAIAQTMNEDDAILLMELGAQPAGTAIGRLFLDRLEHAAVSRIPVEGMANAFELEGAPLPVLRKRAFTQWRASPDQRIYPACLRAIDRLRDHYGKPVTETYHPHITSGHAWPAAAEPLWLAFGYSDDAAN
ncbi:hypothetical protein J2W40_003697 [Sphingobium xenophagum]|uniref:NACHT C-terminal Alpha/Beta 2 domain-containing protein n=1 Tax=Sphingobium xenophagum TaxID=121428 RepID=A0ABU1X5L7_SPHXE|nr:hypothetical protein [Sphingobium xenophagum]MDR7156851.1 hypothetical protein [Sphingobium xenophagum]